MGFWKLFWGFLSVLRDFGIKRVLKGFREFRIFNVSGAVGFSDFFVEYEGIIGNFKN